MEGQAQTISEFSRFIYQLISFLDDQGREDQLFIGKRYHLEKMEMYLKECKAYFYNAFDIAACFG